MSRKSGWKVLILSAAVLLELTLAQTAAGATINDIVKDPRTYVNKTVTIDGRVTGVLSLIVIRYFTVNDGTASINVITEGPLPRRGQPIRVTGKVSEAFAFLSETLLVVIEDKNDKAPPTQKTVLPGGAKPTSGRRL